MSVKPGWPHNHAAPRPRPEEPSFQPGERVRMATGDEAVTVGQLDEDGMAVGPCCLGYTTWIDATEPKLGMVETELVRVQFDDEPFVRSLLSQHFERV